MKVKRRLTSATATLFGDNFNVNGEPVKTTVIETLFAVGSFDFPLLTTIRH